jgi:hypothetical protein
MGRVLERANAREEETDKEGEWKVVRSLLP